MGVSPGLDPGKTSGRCLECSDGVPCDGSCVYTQSGSQELISEDRGQGLSQTISALLGLA